MEESLKSLRQLFRLFGALGIGLLILAINPNKKSGYERALKELKSYEEFRNELSNITIRPKDSLAKWSSQRIEQIIKGVGDPYNVRPFKSEDYSNLFFIEYIPYGSSRNSSPLKAIERSLSGRNFGTQVNLLQFNRNDLRVKLDYLFQDNQDSFIRYFNIRFKDYEDSSFTAYYPDVNYENPSISKATWIVSLTKDSAYFDDNNQVEQEFDVKLEKLSYKKMDLYEGYAKVSAFKRLFKVQGDTIFFPELKKIWKEIKDFDVAKARNFIEGKIKEIEGKQKITFLDLTLEGNLILIGGPISFAIILLYMIAHLIHIHRILDLSTFPTKEFPFIVFFSDKLSKMVSICTLIGLPFFINILLTIRFFHSSFVIPVILLTILCLLLGVAVFRQVKRTTSKLASVSGQ